MEQFFNVNAFQIFQLFILIGGGFWVVGQMKSVQQNQSMRLEAVEKELAELRSVVVSIARQEERLSAMDQRMLSQGQRIDILSNKLYRRYERDAAKED
jgi:hypothetical protein